MTTNYPVDADTESQSAALTVYCPLCLARPGDPCEDAHRGFIVPLTMPHSSRIHAAVLVGAQCDGASSQQEGESK